MGLFAKDAGLLAEDGCGEDVFAIGGEFLEGGEYAFVGVAISDGFGGEFVNAGSGDGEGFFARGRNEFVAEDDAACPVALWVGGDFFGGCGFDFLLGAGGCGGEE